MKSDLQQLDPNCLIGTWWNTSPASRGIERVVIADSGALSIEAFGVGEAEPRRWGAAPISSLYGSGGSAVAGFSADFKLDFAAIKLHCNFAKGLLIISAMTRFTDGSSRSPLFCREFFHRHTQRTS